MDENSPLVSVLMPAYNAEKYIAQSLNSLFSQTYESWELLVADDGSSDRTRAIIDACEDPRIRRFHQEVNQGYLKTWNNLLTEVMGKYITFLDADDYISNDRIAILAEFMNNNPETGVCGTSIAFVNDNHRIVGDRVYPQNWETIRKHLYDPKHFPFCGSAVMVRRQVVAAIGGYRLFFDRTGWEDHDWLIRCCEQFKAANLPQIAYYYRQNVDSVSRFLDDSDNSIRKLTVKKIGLDLALQRKSGGQDYLMEDNRIGLKTIIEKHETPYREDPTLIYRILSQQALTNGKRKSSLFLALRGARKGMFRSANYFAILRSLAAILIA